MAFLRHDLPVSTQEAVLFDCEGGTHVKGRSTRVAQQPGGNSSFSFGWGMDSSSAPPPAGRVSRKGSVHAPQGAVPVVNKENNVPTSSNAFVARKSQVSMGATPVPVHEAPVATTAPAPAPAPLPAPPNTAYSAMYCVEGAQVRTRPGRKVVAPPGGASSIIF